MAIPSLEIQIETAWCLTNIACGDSSQVQLIIPAIPHLIQLLSHPNEVLQDQVCWALGNIAGDSDEVRSVLVAGGAVHAVSELLFSSSADMLGMAASETESVDRRPLTAAWALSNLSRGSTPFAAFSSNDVIARFFKLIKTCITVLTSEKSRDDQGGIVYGQESPFLKPCIELVHELTWTLTFITAKDDSDMTAMLTEDLGRILCESVFIFPAGSQMVFFYAKKSFMHIVIK